MLWKPTTSREIAQRYAVLDHVRPKLQRAINAGNRMSKHKLTTTELYAVSALCENVVGYVLELFTPDEVLRASLRAQRRGVTDPPRHPRRRITPCSTRSSNYSTPSR